MCKILAGKAGLPYVSAVLANTYGPGQISSQLISGSIYKLLQREHVSFSPGEHLYDFIYITDAAEILVRAGELGKANEIYYVGNREPRKLKDYLLEMGKIVAPDAEIGLGEQPYHGVSLSFTEFDVSTAEEKLHYRPRITFAQGIENTMKWLQENQFEHNKKCCQRRFYSVKSP